MMGYYQHIIFTIKIIRMFKTIMILNKELSTDISICIPTYKRVKPLIRCLKSILDLKITNLSIEIIISANSELNDEVKEYIIKNFKVSTFKVNVIEQKNNIGMYKNWNFLLNIATSDWITILNDDDILDNSWTTYVDNYLNSSLNNNKSLFAPSIEMFGSKIPNSNSSKYNKFFQKIRFFKKEYISLSLFDVLNRTIIGGVLNVLFHKDSAKEIYFFDKYYHPSADYLFVSSYIIKFGGYRKLDIGGYYNWEDNDTFKKNRKAKFVIQSFKIRQEIILQEVKYKLVRPVFNLANYIHLYLSYFNYRFEDNKFRINILEKQFYGDFSVMSKVPKKALRIFLRVIYFFGDFKKFSK
tara:strand:+ start:515 stop:1576 length:1062 start_codon:yes stop_codon:yes gene_type:complete